MAVVKAQHASSLLHEAVVLDLGDLQRQAEALKAKARAEAAAILATARQQAEELTAGAAQQGHAQGLEAGKTEGHAAGLTEGRREALEQTATQLQGLQQAFTAMLEEWESQRRQMILEANASLLELAVAIAIRVVKRVPRIDPTVVADQVADAVRWLSRPSDLTIRIHPEDRSLVAAALPQVIGALKDAQHLELLDDPAITRGGCVLSFGKGTIDATLETQLQRIVDTLLPLDPVTPPQMPAGGSEQ